ncbi:MAG: hypothetical protein ACR2P7_03780, partial [bacterium]
MKPSAFKFAARCSLRAVAFAFTLLCATTNALGADAVADEHRITRLATTIEADDTDDSAFCAAGVSAFATPSGSRVVRLATTTST